jgi:hypothetical protein
VSLRRLLPAVVVLLAAAVASSCGVPTDSAARPIAEPTPTPTSSATPTGSPVPAAASIFLVRNNLLVPVSRQVDADAGPQALLDELVAGPTDAETAGGFRSIFTGAIDALEIRDTSPDGTTVVVQLNADLAGVPPPDQPLGIGQIAQTLGAAGATSIGFIGGDGNVLGVPLPDGTIATAAVTPAQYASLVAG